MGRVHGRITKEDVKAAGLRRWNGRQRVTTDWLNLYHEPELCVATGDCLVYLREPGQSSRGPSFRIHISQLVIKGFRSLVDRAVPRPLLHSPESCNIPDCEGCDRSALRELFLPAPPNSSLDSTIDHHITTRNFFAWLYNVPLAGRALGEATVNLKERLDEYRPDSGLRNQLELMSFMEYQKYLDFRECVDHALAALHFAETLKLQDLWIDAFAHCVGLSHRGLRHSLEFAAVSVVTKGLISNAQLEMEVRLDRVGRCVLNFFENDLSGTFLGLHQAAREHFDRFRSFLHAFYIEQHGFWPPENFEDDRVKRSLFSTMYSDFRNLYHYLVDEESSATTTNIAASGGVCTLQNVQAFDQRHHYEALPHPLPMMPTVPNVEATTSSSATKRTSLNLLRKRQANRETRIQLEMQALMNSTNRDWNITGSLLVRRYTEFEQQSVFDDFERVSVVDGRKVRWILIYAVLQTLISVMQAPKPVRNTEGLSYSLCCHAPREMPWTFADLEPPLTAVSSQASTKVEIEPDHAYLHNSRSSTTSSSRTERRASLPTPISASNSQSSSQRQSPSGSSTLRRLLSRGSTGMRARSASNKKSPRPLAFCEIYVQGYGNGLNEVNIETSPVSTSDLDSDEETRRGSDDSSDGSDPSGEPSTPTLSVSRESSSASGYSTRSTTTDGSRNTTDMPDMDHNSINDGESLTDHGERQVKDASNSVGKIHFNTETWDRILAV